jgi:hypothetical protein
MVMASAIRSEMTSICGSPRRIGCGFILALVLVPWLAYWFLWRSGHGTVARVLWAPWLVLNVLFAVMAIHTDSLKPAPVPATPAPTKSAEKQVAYKPTYDENSPEWREAQADRDALINPLPRAGLTLTAWTKGGFGNVMIADFVVKNENKFDIKDFRIVCRGTAASGTALGVTELVLYQQVKSKSKRAFKKVNMGFVDGQTASETCELADVQIIY